MQSINFPNFRGFKIRSELDPRVVASLEEYAEAFFERDDLQLSAIMLAEADEYTAVFYNHRCTLEQTFYDFLDLNEEEFPLDGDALDELNENVAEVEVAANDLKMDEDAPLIA